MTCERMLRSPLGALLTTLFASSCTMSQIQYVGAEAEVSFVAEASEGEAGDVTLGHVYANSWGLYFFGQWPYLSGGIDEQGQPVWAYWRDETRVETVVALLKAEALRQGATHLVDLKSDWISEWVEFSLIFWLAETEASATAVRLTGVPPVGAIPLHPEND